MVFFFTCITFCSWWELIRTSRLKNGFVHGVLWRVLLALFRLNAEMRRALTYSWCKLGYKLDSKLPDGFCCLVAKSCPTLCDPMDCITPGSSVHGVLQARILERVTFPSPGDLPRPGIKPTSLALAGRFLTTEPPGTLFKLNPETKSGATVSVNVSRI